MNNQRLSSTEYHQYQQIPQSTINTQHRNHQTPPSTANTQRSANNFYMNRKQIHESSDDDSNKPVNSTATTITSTSKNPIDSGIEYDQTSPPTSSSSSTIFNQRPMNNHNNNNNKFSSPPITANSVFDEPLKSKLVRRLNPTKTEPIVKNNPQSNLSTNSYWDRLKQIWLRSLLLGLLILFILFFVYFSRLDTCSRSTIIRTVFRKIICIEHEGIPTL
jgi:thiol:disulfide interchange protein